MESSTCSPRRVSSRAAAARAHPRPAHHPQALMAAKKLPGLNLSSSSPYSVKKHNSSYFKKNKKYTTTETEDHAQTRKKKQKTEASTKIRSFRSITWLRALLGVLMVATVVQMWRRAALVVPSKNNTDGLLNSNTPILRRPPGSSAENTAVGDPLAEAGRSLGNRDDNKTEHTDDIKDNAAAAAAPEENKHTGNGSNDERNKPQTKTASTKETNRLIRSNTTPTKNNDKNEEKPKGNKKQSGKKRDEKNSETGNEQKQQLQEVVPRGQSTSGTSQKRMSTSAGTAQKHMEKKQDKRNHETEKEQNQKLQEVVPPDQSTSGTTQRRMEKKKDERNHETGNEQKLQLQEVVPRDQSTSGTTQKRMETKHDERNHELGNEQKPQLQEVPRERSTSRTAQRTQPIIHYGKYFSDDNDSSDSPHPVMDLVELSAQHVEPPSNITAAVCYKTLFGDIDLGLVLQWVAYNRLLGFDHVYMFYRPEVVHLPLFDLLQALPYVTLQENTEGLLRNYYNQDETDKQCLEQAAELQYDYAMVADVDEYWRLVDPKNIDYDNNPGIKDFLQQAKDKNLTYLSFGKRMYTLDHRTDWEAVNYRLDTTAAATGNTTTTNVTSTTSHTSLSASSFALQNYPFYMDHYCNNKKGRIGAVVCPAWQGRAKLIVDPAVHQFVHVHGIYYRTGRIEGAHHFHPSHIANFMEWPHLFKEHNVTRHEPPRGFTVTREDEVHIHNMAEAFRPNAEGSFDVKYDRHLKDWFRSVLHRARVPVTAASMDVVVRNNAHNGGKNDGAASAQA